MKMKHIFAVQEQAELLAYQAFLTNHWARLALRRGRHP